MQLFLFSRKAHLNSKILAAALILLLNLTPVAPVFAALPPQPTLANPDIFTDTAQPRINGSTGAFTQSYSLDIPPGRNGLQPDVTLDYSSQRTQDSIVGYGWQLSIPYIQRINKTGTQDLFGTTPFFTSSIDGELTNTNVTATTSNATTSPTILDALPLSTYKVTNSTSDSRSYTVPAGGINKLFVILLAENGSSVPSATLNGIPVAFSKIPGTSDRMGYFVGYVPSPSSGTFQITFTYSAYARYALMTLQNAAQSYPIDASAVTATTASTSLSTSITTSQGKDLLLSYPWWVNAGFVSFGPNESTLITPGLDVDAGNYAGSYKFASAAIGTETMTIKLDSIKDVDEPVVAIKAFTGGVPIAGNYIARVDNGTDNIYSFAGNTWTVYGKKGTRYLFGSSDAGRQYDTSTGTSTNTYKWYLQEIRDINGNYIKYTYNRDSNELYPNQIIYTGNSASDGPAVISFATSTRP